MAGRFAKLAAGLHRHPKIRRAGRAAREVWVWALCANADEYGEGRVPADFFAPDYLADVLMMPPSEAAEGVLRCVDCGLLARDGDDFVLVGWSAEEWGNGTSTQRVRRFRERNATKRNETLQNVSLVPVTTDGTHETPGTLKHIGEESRGDERRREKDPPVVPLGGTSSSGTRRTRKAKPADPTPEEWVDIELVLGRLSERAGATFAARNSKGHPTESARTVLARLRDGYTERDLRVVIWFKASKWEGDEDFQEYLRPSTLFGPKKIAEYLPHARRAREEYERKRESGAAGRPEVGAPTGAVLAALASAREGQVPS
jgi:uncharacterized phage protein (TIGR02220 family)